MNCKYIYIVLLSLFSGQLSAQYAAKQKHEFTVGVLAGVSALDSKLAEGSTSSKFSGGVGFGYTCFFRENIGFVTGIELVFYQTDVKLDNFAGSQRTFAFDIDEQNEFDFKYILNNYKETQSAFYLNIPIMVNYQFSTEKKANFYVAGGFKVGLPLSGKYKSSGANLKTWAYFPHNNAILEGPHFRGFGDFVSKKSDNEIKYKVAFNISLETGIKWKLPKNMALYTGIYLDYGLNNVNENTKTEHSLVGYNQLKPDEHIYNGIASSSYKDEDGNIQYLTSKVKPIAYGLKIRLAFGKTKR